MLELHHGWITHLPVTFLVHLLIYQGTSLLVVQVHPVSRKLLVIHLQIQLLEFLKHKNF